MTQVNGDPDYDRNYWGMPFSLNGQVMVKGIGVMPNSEISYRLEGEWDRFSAILSADLNPFSGQHRHDYKGGKIQFGIWGDGRQLFMSKVMDVNSEPQPVDIPLTGITKLTLTVRTQDWLPYFAQSASWMDAKLTRE